VPTLKFDLQLQLTTIAMIRLSIPRSLIRASLCKSVRSSRTIPRFFVLPQSRAFINSPTVFAKKAQKEATGGATESAIDFDAQFAKLENEIARITDKLKEDLSKLRTGRADPGILEALEVVVDKSMHTAVLLKDVAHVVTKGRALAVTVYEAANVKKVVSAIQIAELNLQPVTDTKNPLLIMVPLPPPTKESRTEAANQAAKVGNKAQDAVRNARLVTHKKIQAAKKGVRPDDFKKADKKMEDIVKKRKAEVEAVIAAARKGIMEG